MKDLLYVKNFRMNLIYKEKTEILSLGEKGDQVWMGYERITLDAML